MATVKQAQVGWVARGFVIFFTCMGVLGWWSPWERVLLRVSHTMQGGPVSQLKIESKPDPTATALGLEQVLGAVIHRNITPFAKEVVINKGAKDGLATGMIAMSDGWLLGKITKVSAEHAWVTLVSDPSFKLGVRIAGVDALGIVKGLSTVISLDRVPSGIQLSGKLVATYGDEVAVAGLPVGICRDRPVTVASGTIKNWLVDRPLREEFAQQVQVVLPRRSPQ